MPSTFYIVKLPLALGNIFNWTESIIARSHDDAENQNWGLIMDFWHCLIVMTYRNRALFRLELGSTWLSRFRIVMRPCFPMYFTLDSSHKIAKCQKKKNETSEIGTDLGFSPVSVKQTQRLALRLLKYTGVQLIGWLIVTGIVLSSCQHFK